jgi:hypothetical protein
MVSASMTGVRAWVERLLEPRLLRPSFQGTALVFAVSGSVSAEPERSDAVDLQAWDLAVISPDERGCIRPAGLDAGAAPLVFFAALDDNSR